MPRSSMNRRNWISLTVASLVPAAAQAQLGDILRGIAGRGAALPGGLSDVDTAAGLKEALATGTANAVRLTGVLDGFFKNEAIRILLPERLRALDKPLRFAGMGPQLDAFVLSMNRAAEKAAPAAETFFKDAIRQMTFDDAKGILTGGNTAATDFFRRRTSDPLRTAFTPVVKGAMDDTGVGRQFNAIAASPLGKVAGLDLDGYVVTKTLDGLFWALAQEEQKIRTNPAAQVTPLLRKVFGRK